MIPFKVMETAFSGFPLIREMTEKGNPSSVTDAGVGAMALRTCIRGAFLNVKINAAGLDDKTFAKEIFEKASDLETKAMIEEEVILKIVEASILKQSKS
jgi:glutamate formiminotransferase / formiminotetrahydrofolate cyclodeaminase